MCAWVLSHVWPFATLWTASHQGPLSLGLSSQEDWSGLSCPPPGILPTQGSDLHPYISCSGRWVLYHQHHLGSSNKR